MSNTTIALLIIPQKISPHQAGKSTKSNGQVQNDESYSAGTSNISRENPFSNALLSQGTFPKVFQPTYQSSTESIQNDQDSSESDVATSRPVEVNLPEETPPCCVPTPTPLQSLPFAPPKLPCNHDQDKASAVCRQRCNLTAKHPDPFCTPSLLPPNM